MYIHLLSSCTITPPWESIRDSGVIESLPHGINLPSFEWLNKGEQESHDFLLEDESRGLFKAVARYLVDEYSDEAAPCLYLTALSSFNSPLRAPSTYVRTLPVALRALNNALIELGERPVFAAHTFKLEGRTSLRGIHDRLCNWLRRRDLSVDDKLSSVVQVPASHPVGINIKHLLHEEAVASMAAQRAVRLGFEESYRGDAFRFFFMKLIEMRKVGVRLPLEMSRQQAEKLVAALI